MPIINIKCHVLRCYHPLDRMFPILRISTAAAGQFGLIRSHLIYAA